MLGLVQNFLEYVSPWKAKPETEFNVSDDSENDALQLNFDSPGSAPAKKKRSRAAAAAPRPSPAKKARKSPTKTARKSSAKKARAAGRSAVKRERLRRSARSTGYKKGAYSQSQLERQAWRGTGTRKDPIQL